MRYSQTSHSYSCPSAVTTPFSVICVMGLFVRLQLGLENDSRYPGPGVTRRQPISHLGMSFSHRSGSWFSFSAIWAVAARTVSWLNSPLMNCTYVSFCNLQSIPVSTYQTEGLICAMNYSLAVISMFDRITKFGLFLVEIFWIRIHSISSKMLGGGNPIVNPSRAPNEVSHSSTWQLGHLWHNLNS